MPFTAEELAERKNFIGASDAPAVLGMSRYRSPLELWAEKTGLVEPEDISQKYPVRYGEKDEQTVAEMFTEDTGKKVHRVNEAFIHPEYPFIRCHIDRKVEGEDAILQCKSFSEYRAKEFEGDELPPECIIQEFHELACSKYKKAYIAARIGNSQLVIKEVLFDKKTIDAIIQKEVYFWESFVKTKIMPQIITKNDDDILQKMFPSAVEGQEVALPGNVNIIIETLQALSQEEKLIAGQIKKYKNELKAMVKENEVGNTGIYKVKWSNVHKDEYTVKAQDYRQLRYSEIKKEA